MLSPFLAHLWLGAPLSWLCLGCGQVAALLELPPSWQPPFPSGLHWDLRAEGSPVQCPAHPACTRGWVERGALEPLLVLQVPSAQLGLVL